MIDYLNKWWVVYQLSRKKVSACNIQFCAAYAYRFCSPSRSALNSGRLPVHAKTQTLNHTIVILASWAGPLPENATHAPGARQVAGAREHTKCQTRRP